MTGHAGVNGVTPPLRAPFTLAGACRYKQPALRPATVFEFEPTDLAAARAALDEPPPGLERLPEFIPDYWASRRRSPKPTDRALTGEAIQWMLSLPPSLRPQQLCERYPRVANALAAAWPDARLRGILLHSLTHDQRGNRRGFPEEVRREVDLLHHANAWRASHGRG